MAQRDVPEVNAGSMADIAFLLLIFFLVTTTMDKDTAYIRNIPQPIDVKEPTKVMKRNILAIKSTEQKLEYSYPKFLHTQKMKTIFQITLLGLNKAHL